MTSRLVMQLIIILKYNKIVKTEVPDSVWNVTNPTNCYNRGPSDKATIIN